MHYRPIPQPANYTAAPERTTHRGEPAQPANPELMEQWFCRACGQGIATLFDTRTMKRIISPHFVKRDVALPERSEKCRHSGKALDDKHAEARSA
jgi:hypothetical protein